MAEPATPSEAYRTILGVVVGPRFPVNRRTRVAWGITALVCASILGTAVYLPPNPAGHGTHEALGLPACGFILRTGFPCPTCGMTTAYSLFVRGRWIDSFVTQPAGMILAALTAALMVLAARVAIAGRMAYVDWDRASVRLMTGLGILILFGWGFVMAHGLSLGTLPHGAE